MRDITKHKSRKLSAIICIFAFLIILTRGTTQTRMTVHAADQTAKVTKQVNAYMAAIRKYDIKKMKKVQIDKDVYHITDKRIQKYIRRINREQLSYEIKRVKIKGESATVYIHVRQYNSYEDVYNALHYTLREYKKSWNSKKFYKSLYENLIWAYETNDEPDYNDQNIKIKLVKQGNKWMIPKLTKNMFIIKDAGLTYFLDDFSKHPRDYL